MLELMDIVKKCQEEDPLAQKELYDRYAPLLMGVCLRYAKDNSEAEDVLQEGFLKIFEKVKEFDHTLGSFEAWMRKIVVNMAISNYRQNLKRYYQEEVESIDEQEIVFETQQGDFTKDELMGVIASLSPGYRMVFNLFAIEGYKHKEIAEMLEIDEATSKSQYSRAKKKIQEELLELGRERI